MNTKLVFVVVLILTSVYSMPSIDDDRDDYTEPPETDDEDDNEDLIVDSTTSVSFEQLDEVEDEYEYGKISRWTLPLAMLFRKQLVGLLKQDLKDAYQRKCTKISADANAFERFMNGKTELKNCTKMWLTNPQDETMANVIKTKDFKSIVMTFCQKRDGLFNCFNDFKALKDRCSFPSEIERANQLRDIVKAILDSLCSNGGSDLVSLVSHDGEGRKCIIENANEIRTCRNKAVYAVAKRILTKFIENEHFEFKMNKDDCNEFDAVKECFVTSVENCVDPIAKNQITSMFRIFREQTSCGTAS